jgi:hypothetical protein
MVRRVRMRLKVTVGWLRSNLHKVAATNAKSGRLQANGRRMSGARATLE